MWSVHYFLCKQILTSISGGDEVRLSRVAGRRTPLHISLIRKTN